MERDEKHLKEFLHEAGFLSPAQIAAVHEEATRSGESFAHTLVRTGRMQEEAVRRATAKSLSVPYTELESHEFDDTALTELPEPFCRTHSVVAYKKEGNTLVVLLLDLAELDALRDLRLLYAVVGHLTSRQTLKRGLLRYQKVLAKRHADSISEAGRVIQPPLSYTEDALLYGADRLPVKNAMDALIEHALSQRATDIHLEPRVQGLLVRYRIGRNLHDAMLLPPHTAQSVVSRAKMLAKLPLEATVPREGRFKVLHEGRGEIVMCVQTMPVASGSAKEKVVMHVGMPAQGQSSFSLESLGLHGRALEVVHTALQKREGLIVVHGAASSGKTTFLYTLLDLLIEPATSIATVEDSVELLLPGVTQSEVAHGEGVTLAGRLRAVLRADPDVLMVSTESLQYVAPAVYAANAGKLVLLQVPGSSLEEALETLVAQDVSLYSISTTLRAVIGVMLVRRLCTKHTHTKLSREELQEFEARGARLPLILEALKEESVVDEHAQWKEIQFGRAVVCEECDDGYVGHIGLQEVTPASLTLREALRENNPTALRVSGNAQLTLLEDGIYKAALGLTSIEEVLNATL